MKTAIDKVNEYIERHRAWSLILKQVLESQIRRTAGEDSEGESQGN
jgi:hypothetical protein